MAVTERFREIGTMKCLGALNMFILELFLLESGFQGLAGALVGAFLGVLATFLVGLKNHGLDLIWNYPLLRILLVVVVASILGMILSVIGAAVPALRAARMHPSEAMRVEA
jgi:ABC-type lipoprotein release transport system permease subunit